MKLEDLIEIIDRYGEHGLLPTTVEEIQKYLEKQIPMTVSIKNKDVLCPACLVHLKDSEKYCRNCGQKLLWEVVE